MTDNQDAYYESLRGHARRRDEMSTRTALEIIDREGKTYSGELKKALGMSVTYARSILVALEKKDVLVSWLQDPPHDGLKSGGLQRRYYARRDGEAVPRRAANAVTREEAYYWLNSQVKHAKATLDFRPCPLCNDYVTEWQAYVEAGKWVAHFSCAAENRVLDYLCGATDRLGMSPEADEFAAKLKGQDGGEDGDLSTSVADNEG